MNNSDAITIIAIDRAEQDLVGACEQLKLTFGKDVNAYLLVSKQYKNSSLYHGDETDGYFNEIICDFYNPEEMRKIVSEIATDKTAVFCRSESGIKDLGKIVDIFPQFFAPDSTALLTSTDKNLMRLSISRLHPELCPKYIPVRSVEEYYTIDKSKLLYPVIVKPMGLNSSMLVNKCWSQDELDICIKDIFKIVSIVYEREIGTGQPGLLIEEFMIGNMYSIDAYINSSSEVFFLPPVRVLTGAEMGVDGYYSYRHILPCELSEDEINSANQATEKAMKAVGLRSSTAHVELFKTATGWKIIELGPRIGGYRQEIYMEAFGINHFYNDLLLHLGENPDMNKKWIKHAAGFNIYADREGLIKKISGVDEAKQAESVIKLNLSAKVGDKSVFASNGGHYLVDGILANESKEQLEVDMAKIRQLIKFDIV